MPSVKLQAVFILILLSGHEAARIHEASNLTSLSLEGDGQVGKPTEWEKKFKEINKDCEWESRYGYCFGKGCVYNYLPLDTGLSVCKKSDEYLLKTEPVESVKMYAGILKSKSEKYTAKCQGRLSWMNPWCKRRLQHMFNAVKFLAFAQEQSAAGKADVADAFANSMTSMAQSFGEDGQLVEKLKEKVASSKAMETNPEGTVKKMLDLIQKLTTGGPEEHDAAKQEIESSAPFQATSDGDIEASQEVEASESMDPMDADEEMEVQAAKDSMAQQLAQLTDAASPPEGGAGNSSAMLQVDSSEVQVKYMAGALFAVVAVGAAILMAGAIVEILVGALIAYVVLSVFSCGLFHAGVWYGSNHKYEQNEVPKEGANETVSAAPNQVDVPGMSKKTAVKNALVCTGKFLLLPVKLVYYTGKWTVRGIKYLYRKARGNSTKATK